jgi:glutamine amidotransferase
MGWNDLKVEVPCPCLEGISDGDYFYFVHSYYAAPKVPEVTLASCDYGMKFAAIIGRDNIFATQFHPEKSQDKGLMILKNFVNSIGGKTA